MEIERKWMVTGWPEGLPMTEEFTMRQGLHQRAAHRPASGKKPKPAATPPGFSVFKSAGGLAREEIERPIDQALFEELEHKIIGRPLDREGPPHLPPARRLHAGSQPCGRRPAGGLLVRRNRIPHHSRRQPVGPCRRRPGRLPVRGSHRPAGPVDGRLLGADPGLKQRR